MPDVVELEITGKCQLECSHCYANSGPTGGHGTMTTPQWEGVITQLAELGVSEVQFIGGEPTLHPDLVRLIRFAVNTGLAVEVFSNLVNVRPEAWEAFELPGVSLATSYYTDDPVTWAEITKRPSYERTKTNLTEALGRGIPVRVGVIDVHDGQRVEEAHTELVRLGIPADNIRQDRVRGFGRATEAAPDPSELCGQCGLGRAAISPDGDVWPCVMSRWMIAGNVRQQPLGEILAGPEMRRLMGQIPHPVEAYCAPDACNPHCGPFAGCPPWQACSPNKVWDPAHQAARGVVN